MAEKVFNSEEAERLLPDVERLLRSPIDSKKALDPKAVIGRSPEQVDEFLAEVIAPIRQRYANRSKPTASWSSPPHSPARSPSGGATSTVPSASV